MQTLKALVDAGDFVVAPVALNPVMARLAEDAGFKAVYLSGGSLGWLKCVTEANLSLSDMVQVAVDIRSVQDSDRSRRRRRLGRAGAHPPHHCDVGGRRLRGHRDRGPVSATAGAAPYRRGEP